MAIAATPSILTYYCIQASSASTSSLLAIRLEFERLADISERLLISTDMSFTAGSDNNSACQMIT